MKLKCGLGQEAQIVYEEVLSADAAASADKKLSAKARELVLRKIEEAKVAVLATDLFPGWRPSQGVIGAAPSPPRLSSAMSRNHSFDSNYAPSHAGSVGTPDTSFEAFGAPAARRERVSDAMKAVVDECMTLASRANQESALPKARVVYLACAAMMPGRVEVRARCHHVAPPQGGGGIGVIFCFGGINPTHTHTHTHTPVQHTHSTRCRYHLIRQCSSTALTLSVSTTRRASSL